MVYYLDYFIMLLGLGKGLPFTEVLERKIGSPLQNLLSTGAFEKNCKVGNPIVQEFVIRAKKFFGP